MKRCIVVAEEINFGPIPVKGPLEVKLPELSESGYHDLELHLKYPFTRSVKQLKELLNKHQFHVQILAVGYLYFMENLSLTDQDPTIRKRAIEGVSQYIEVASQLGSQISIGSIRGFWPNVDQQQCMSIFMDSLRICLDKAEKEGVTLSLEPINRYEMNLVNTVQEGLAVIKEQGSPNLKLMLDTFHMNIEEPSIYESTNRSRSSQSGFCGSIFIVS